MRSEWQRREGVHEIVPPPRAELTSTVVWPAKTRSNVRVCVLCGTHAQGAGLREEESVKAVCW